MMMMFPTVLNSSYVQGYQNTSLLLFDRYVFHLLGSMGGGCSFRWKDTSKGIMPERFLDHTRAVSKVLLFFLGSKVFLKSFVRIMQEPTAGVLPLNAEGVFFE